MFKTNKYTKLYFSIIENAKSKNRSKKEGYYEKHHIIPKCTPFCGKDSADNLVLLTAKEHFICHMLLTRMCDGNAKYKMVCALNNMTRISPGQERSLTAAQYEYTKKQLSLIKTGTKHKPETIEKFKNRIPWNKGKDKHTDERIHAFAKNMSGENHHRPMLGKPVSDEMRKMISDRQTGETNSFFGKTHTKEVRKRISEAQTGRKHTEETKQKIRESKKKENAGAEAVRGSRWINNGNKNLLLKRGEAMPDGYTYGKCKAEKAL